MRVDIGQAVAPVLRHANRQRRNPPLPKVVEAGHRLARARRLTLTRT